MAWFFADSVNTPVHTITGEDAVHITKSLRMKQGEQITICDADEMRYDCVIENISGGTVDVRVIESCHCDNEPTAFVTLYQALAKGDKMDFIIQKAVELGVKEIVPVLTDRCVSRPDEKSAKKKTERWNKIALQAAQQSRRGTVPKVLPVMKLEQAVQRAGNTAVVCYELGGEPLGKRTASRKDKLSLFIGSEGGFERFEIDMILSHGGECATLGKRILRAETAPIAALSVIMYLTDNLGTDTTPIRDDNGEDIRGGDWSYL